MGKLQDFAVESPKAGAGSWTVPESVLPKLQALSEAAGMSGADFSLLAQKMTDDGGVMGLDQFFGALVRHFEQIANPPSVSIPETDLPFLQSILGQLGVPPAEMRAATEPAVTGDDKLDLSVLIQGINKLEPVETVPDITLTDWEVEQLSDILAKAGVADTFRAELLAGLKSPEAGRQQVSLTLSLTKFTQVLAAGLQNVKEQRAVADLPEFVTGLNDLLQEAGLTGENRQWTPLLAKSITDIHEELRNIISLATVKSEKQPTSWRDAAVMTWQQSEGNWPNNFNPEIPLSYQQNFSEIRVPQGQEEVAAQTLAVAETEEIVAPAGHTKTLQAQVQETGIPSIPASFHKNMPTQSSEQNIVVPMTGQPVVQAQETQGEGIPLAGVQQVVVKEAIPSKASFATIPSEVSSSVVQPTVSSSVVQSVVQPEVVGTTDPSIAVNITLRSAVGQPTVLSERVTAEVSSAVAQPAVQSEVVGAAGPSLVVNATLRSDGVQPAVPFEVLAAAVSSQVAKEEIPATVTDNRPVAMMPGSMTLKTDVTTRDSADVVELLPEGVVPEAIPGKTMDRRQTVDIPVVMSLHKEAAVSDSMKATAIPAQGNTAGGVNSGPIETLSASLISSDGDGVHAAVKEMSVQSQQGLGRESESSFVNPSAKTDRLGFTQSQVSSQQPPATVDSLKGEGKNEVGVQADQLATDLNPTEHGETKVGLSANDKQTSVPFDMGKRQVKEVTKTDRFGATEIAPEDGAALAVDPGTSQDIPELLVTPESDTSQASMREVPAQAQQYTAPSELSASARASAELDNLAPPRTQAPIQHQQQIIDQLARGMMRGLQNKEHHLVMRLNPPELGEVKIDLIVRNEHVSVSFAMENSRVKEAIESSMQQFQENLEQRGFKLGQFSVNVGQQQDDRKQAWQEFSQNRGQQRSRTLKPIDSSLNAPYPRPTTVPGQGNGISLFV